VIGNALYLVGGSNTNDNVQIRATPAAPAC
jgi:hypothetical protein